MEQVQLQLMSGFKSKNQQAFSSIKQFGSLFHLTSNDFEVTSNILQVHFESISKSLQRLSKSLQSRFKNRIFSNLLNAILRTSKICGNFRHFAGNYNNCIAYGRFFPYLVQIISLTSCKFFPPPPEKNCAVNISYINF